MLLEAGARWQNLYTDISIVGMLFEQLLASRKDDLSVDGLRLPMANIRLLLSMDANVDGRFHRDRKLLQHACAANLETSVVQLLLDARAFPNQAVELEGEITTPLEVTVSAHNVSLVRVLLKAHADPLLCNNACGFGYDVADKSADSKECQKLIEQAVKEHYLHRQARASSWTPPSLPSHPHSPRTCLVPCSYHTLAVRSSGAWPSGYCGRGDDQGL